MKNIVEKLPLRINKINGRITMSAPMPGLSPEDIDITIGQQSVLLRGEKRGSSQPDMDLIVDEWEIGPYIRAIELPDKVRGDLANATYGNGILVLSLPIAKSGEESVSANFQLRPVGASHGERIGHIGQEIRPKTTDEHLRKHR